MDKQIAYSLLTIKEVSEDQRVIRGMATTPEADRVGDIVDPLGVQFKNPAPLLWMHRHDLPVGSVTFGKPTEKGVPFEARLPSVAEPSQLKARIDEAWESVKAGLVRAVSIGFRALEYSVIEDTGGLRFTRTDVYELSLVTVPANPGATISQIKAFDSEYRASLGKKVDEKVLKTSPGVSGKKSVIKLEIKENKMDFGKQIEGFRKQLETKNTRLVELAKKSADEGQTFDEAEQEEFDTVSSEVKTIEDHIKRLETAQKVSSSTAKPIDVKAGENEKAGLAARNSSIQLKVQEKTEPGIDFARYAMCLVAAKNNPTVALELAKSHYGPEAVVARVLDSQSKGINFAKALDMSKAAVAAGTTLNSTWAQPLVEYTTLASEFIAYLRPQTIIGQFGQGGVPSLRQIPFNVRIPRQTSAASANWVGEGAAKPVTKMDFDDVELRWAKIAAIAVLTEELIRFSDPSAERLVRDELARAVIERMDIDFVDPAKAVSANVSPASITNGLTPIASTGSDADAISCDLQALWAPFIAANNAPRQAVYIMDSVTALALSQMKNPLGQREYPGLTMTGGNFDGVPTIVSDYLPVDSGGHMVILANASDIFFSDDGQVTLDASREASIQMDTTPTQNSTGTPVATAAVSMFQTNSVALRAERYINWAKRRASAVQYLDNVNWGACASS